VAPANKKEPAEAVFDRFSQEAPHRHSSFRDQSFDTDELKKHVRSWGRLRARNHFVFLEQDARAMVPRRGDYCLCLG